jgi:hypothetical protein
MRERDPYYPGSAIVLFWAGILERNHPQARRTSKMTLNLVASENY